MRTIWRYRRWRYRRCVNCWAMTSYGRLGIDCVRMTGLTVASELLAGGILAGLWWLPR